MKRTTNYEMKLKYAIDNLYVYLYKAGIQSKERGLVVNNLVRLDMMLLDSNELLIGKDLSFIVPFNDIWELEDSINILRRRSYINNYAYTLSGRVISAMLNIHFLNSNSAKIISINLGSKLKAA